MSARLSAIVVTFNNRGDVAACLESLRRSTRVPDEILVLDNASQDGTPDRVRRDFPDVTVLDYWDNPGFGEAHNRAFRVATGERYLLLNPDATIAADGIERLERAMDADPRLGVAVPKVRLSREPEVLNSVGVEMNQIGYGWDRGYLEWDRGQYDAAGPVLAGSGCALLLSAAMVRAVGGFDPAYFLYYEDLDLCLRSWLAGFPVRYVPEAVALHAMKVSGRPAFYGDYLDHRNRLRTVLKTLPGPLLARALARSACFDGASVLRALGRGRGTEAGRRLAAWAWNAAHLPETIGLRRLARNGRPTGEDWPAMMADGAGLPRVRAALPTYDEVYGDTLDPALLGPELRMGADERGRLGLGWHDLEESEGVRYRWSCGYGIVFLRAQPGPAELRIVCRSLRETLVRIVLDRRPQGEMRVLPGGWTEHVHPVRCEQQSARLELFPAEAVPADSLPGSSDHRTLGLAVRSMRLARPERS